MLSQRAPHGVTKASTIILGRIAYVTRLIWPLKPLPVLVLSTHYDFWHAVFHYEEFWMHFGPYRSVVYVYVCVKVTRICLQKRLNRPRCRLGG